ncbi:MAG: hypothetical protein RMM28_00505 [Thermoleophilia bacterium]|nr:hypothetical protein [Gaiellaceae bacterium]MDW8337605.1 hypothetical protein [Thermoleophilia bacterium]
MTHALDPARHWLAAGITGIARSREWDAVVAVEAPGQLGDEVAFVALADGRVLREEGSSIDVEPLVSALRGAIGPPYRAFGVRKPELWTVGAVAIVVVELGEDPGGDEIEVVRRADGMSVRVDGRPTAPPLPELERLGEARAPEYVVRARRLEGALYEVEVEPL